MLAESIHALLSSEANGADGEAEFSGNFGVGASGSLVEKKLDEAAALRGESEDGIAKHLLFLGLLDEGLGDGGGFRIEQVGTFVIAADETLLLVLPAVTMMMGDLHEPLGERACIAKFGKAVEKLDAGGLKNFGGFVRGQTIFDGDGVDKGFVFFDELRPGFLASGEAFPDKELVG